MPGRRFEAGEDSEDMALLKNVEKRIWDVEQFDVVIRHSGGRDMRGDRTGIPMYTYDRMAKNSITVSAWKEQRFSPSYPGFEVDVLDGVGQTVAGNTLLSTVRDSYAED
jgi:hypothetical protein